MPMKRQDPQETRELLLRGLRMVGSYIYHHAEDIAPQNMGGILEDGIGLKVRLSGDGMPVVTETIDRYCACDIILQPDSENGRWKGCPDVPPE